MFGSHDLMIVVAILFFTFVLAIKSDCGVKLFNYAGPKSA